MKCIAVAILLACLAAQTSSASAAAVAKHKTQSVVWRHQFQYYLHNASMANLTTVQDVWESFTGNESYAANAGCIVQASFGSDLGLHDMLYNASNQTNADFAGRVDFVSKQCLINFWQGMYELDAYQSMLALVSHAARIQYLPPYAAPSTTMGYRTTFEYDFTPVNHTSATRNTTGALSNVVQNGVQTWTALIQMSPVTPVVYAFGADLGLGPQLYPTLNYQMGGSVTFSTKAKLVAFWKWIYAQPEYMALINATTNVVRIQYMA